MLFGISLSYSSISVSGKNIAMHLKSSSAVEDAFGHYKENCHIYELTTSQRSLGGSNDINNDSKGIQQKNYEKEGKNTRNPE
jgi:hypothetical protein